MNWHSLIEDEQKNLSSARCGLWSTLLFTFFLVLLDTFGVVSMSQAAYTLLGGLLFAFAAWSGGPRAMQYLGPQAAKFADALGRASTAKREPDIRTDDERGD